MRDAGYGMRDAKRGIGFQPVVWDLTGLEENTLKRELQQLAPQSNEVIQVRELIKAAVIKQ